MPATSPSELQLLAGRRILVTGVVNKESIAFAAAAHAQRAGAEVLLTSFGRVRSLTERAARQLPVPADVLELDVMKAEDFAALREELRRRWGSVDGALHAVAAAPQDALGGNFMHTPAESAASAFLTSAYSLKALAEALLPLMSSAGGSLVALDFDDPVAWPMYDWMGVAKAALRKMTGYLTRDLGPQGVRVNVVSAGPMSTVAGRAVPMFDPMVEIWERHAPVGWNARDPGPIADAVCFLLSEWARGISGELVHVDGGVHATGTFIPYSAP